MPRNSHTTGAPARKRFTTPVLLGWSALALVAWVGVSASMVYPEHVDYPSPSGQRNFISLWKNAGFGGARCLLYVSDPAHKNGEPVFVGTPVSFSGVTWSGDGTLVALSSQHGPEAEVHFDAAYDFRTRQWLKADEPGEPFREMERHIKSLLASRGGPVPVGPERHNIPLWEQAKWSALDPS